MIWTIINVFKSSGRSLGTQTNTMASSTFSKLAKIYEASQVVSLNSLETLIQNKTLQITPDFSSPDDPFPVKFCLDLNFGRKKEGYLSVYINNQSKRRVYVEHQSLTMSTNVCLKQKQYNSLQVFESVDYVKEDDDEKSNNWGWSEFYELSDLKKLKTPNQDWDIQIHFKIWYFGEFKETSNTSKIKARYPLRKLSDDLLYRFTNEKDSDVSFLVDGKVVRAHRYILSARSDYFESMFHSGMVEASSDEIQIKDCDVDLFSTMIKFLYTDVPPEEIDEIATKLLPVADQFLVPNLKYHCEESIVKALNQENVKENLILAHLCNCPELKNRCFEELTRSVFNDCSELKSYPDLLVEYLQFRSNRHGS